VTDDVLAQQRQLYGEPIGELVRRIGATLELTQGAVARVIGMSPAMLSQLVSGQRTKIGNPLVLGRFQALNELAATVVAGPRPSEDELSARLDAIASSDATLTSTVAPETRVPESVRRLLRAVASGRELEAAAAAVAEVAPGVAEVLRAYGTGSAEEANAHYRGIAHLLR